MESNAAVFFARGSVLPIRASFGMGWVSARDFHDFEAQNTGFEFTLLEKLAWLGWVDLAVRGTRFGDFLGRGGLLHLLGGFIEFRA